jgi:apolipoprotein N-acyltransferase
MTPAASSAARLAAASALGAIAVAAFGDWPIFPLPLLALAALDWLWLRAASPRAAAALGFAFGLGHFLVGVSWVYISLHDFGGLSAPIAGLATIVFCLILAAYPAAVGWAQAKLAAPAPARLAAPAPVRLALPVAVRLMLVIPAAWALAEWLRGWILTGFPWLALGYSQLDGPLAGFAPVAGVFGVSFLAAAVAGALLALFVTRGAARIAAVATIGAITVGGWGLRAIDWTTPYGEPLDVALLQGNIPQELKFVPGRYQATLDAYARLAGSTNARLVVLPETAIRASSRGGAGYLERLKAIVAARGGDLLVGVPILDPERRYYNAVVSLGTSPTQAYAKSHLVPFGEFLPPGSAGWSR